MGNGNMKAFRAQAYIFKRYIWLLSLLYDYKRLSYKEISLKWEHSSLNDDDGNALPKRTFHDHINAIQEIFGISIKNENKGDYKYYIDNIDDITTNRLHSWMLDNFSICNALSNAKNIEDRILFQDIPSSKRWLSTIIDAINNKNILIVEYTSYTSGKTPTLQLCPLFVKLYENRWYVYAKSTDNDLMKHYALDRIDNVIVSEEQFDYEPSKEERYILDNCFGHSIYPGIDPQIIYLRATPKASKYLDSLPLHHSQEKVKDEIDYVVYKYFFAPTPDFTNVLKKWRGQLSLISNEDLNDL